MAKTLTIHCIDCKKSRLFVGCDVDEIIAKIDASGWRDDPGGLQPIGHTNGLCPTCRDRIDEDMLGEPE